MMKYILIIFSIFFIVLTDDNYKGPFEEPIEKTDDFITEVKNLDTEANTFKKELITK